MNKDESRPEDYLSAAHRMQSAVALDLSIEYSDAEAWLVDALKHLRVGINSAMANDYAMAKLLIAKGVFTEPEYLEAVRVAMVEEADRCAAKVQKRYPNTKLSFG